MQNLTIILLFFVIATLALAQDAISSTSGVDPGFLDYHVIRFYVSRFEQVDEASIQWGRAVLAELDIESETILEKAQAILRYVHGQFAFEGNDVSRIADFIARREGNCEAHARLSIFLLRLAGIPAKYARESHLNMTGHGAGEAARKYNRGEFGAFHNAHVWVFFHDGNGWQPFDSSLGYLGHEDFMDFRWRRPPGVTAGPPIVIWEDTGKGFDSMKNVTAEIWNRHELSDHRGITRKSWAEFITRFSKLDRKIIAKRMPEANLKEIERMARRYFVPMRVDADRIPAHLRIHLMDFTRDGETYLFYEYELSARALELAEQGHPDLGESLIRVSLDANPKSLWLRWTLGRIYRSSRRPDKAKAIYRSMLIIDPDNTWARHWIDVIDKTTGK